MQTEQLFTFQGELWDGHGRHFDAWHWSWQASDGPTAGEAVPVSLGDALPLICKDMGARRVPVGVIGPRDATDHQIETAQRVGELLADSGLALVCGGMTGVMTAAAEGAQRRGGLTIGLLPGSDWRDANRFIALPIATGLSEGRNMVIAKSSTALICVGGSYGTLSEVAYGLHFGKPVLGLAGAPDVPGVTQLESVDEILPVLAKHLIFGNKAS